MHEVPADKGAFLRFLHPAVVSSRLPMSSAGNRSPARPCPPPPLVAPLPPIFSQLDFDTGSTRWPSQPLQWRGRANFFGAGLVGARDVFLAEFLFCPKCLLITWFQMSNFSRFFYLKEISKNPRGRHILTSTSWIWNFEKAVVIVMAKKLTILNFRFTTCICVLALAYLVSK